MNGWEHDKAWSDTLMPEIKSVLGQKLIGPAPDVEDQQHNTDLIVLHMAAVRIAVRLRRWTSIKYRDEFTLRAKRPSGVETEFQKMMADWGDYFFYAFANDTSQYLVQWLLLDLSRFRDYCRALPKLPDLKWNHDRSSAFHSFKVAEIPPSCVVAAMPSPGNPGPLE